MSENKQFSLEMTIAEAMAVDPRVAQIFAAFHLGGCAHCQINQVETLGQVCQGYGIDTGQLMEALGSLTAEESTEAPSAT